MALDLGPMASHIPSHSGISFGQRASQLCASGAPASSPMGQGIDRLHTPPQSQSIAAMAREQLLDSRQERLDEYNDALKARRADQELALRKVQETISARVPMGHPLARIADVRSTLTQRGSISSGGRR